MEIKRIDSGLEGLDSHSVLTAPGQQCFEVRPRFLPRDSEGSLTIPPVPQYQLLQLVQAKVDGVVALHDHVALLEILLV